MHLITFCFDDGFKQSSIRTAEVFEKFNLRASFFVLASGTFAGAYDPNPPYAIGDFGLWNELVARGHDVLPHGYHHANKKQLPFESACGLIEQCFDIFDRDLRGFDRRKTVFGYPYGASSPQLNAWLCSQIRAVRVGDMPPQTKGINPLPGPDLNIITTISSGPEEVSAAVEKSVSSFLNDPLGGWFVFSGHGMDGEGWGPWNSDSLARLLEKLVTQGKAPVQSLQQALGNVK